MKRYRPVLSYIIIGLMVIASGPLLNTEAHAKAVRIGIVYDGDSERFPGVRKLVENEIFSITRGAHTVSFPKSQQLSGGYELAKIKRALDQIMASKQVDLVLTLGEVATNEVCQRRDLPKPVIAAYVIDAEIQGLPSRKGTSGVKNLNYINILADIDRAFQAFLDITPFYRVVFLTDGFLSRSIPQMKKLERRLAAEFTLDLKTIQVETEAGSILEQIPEGTDAVFIGLLPRLSHSEFQKLVDGLLDKKLPSFSFRGLPDVEKGALVTTIPADSIQHMARSIAINVQEVLDGTNAGDLQTTFALGEQLTINMATARNIRIYPSWGTLTEANLLNEEDTRIVRQLDIWQAVNEALVANLDLAVATRQVEAGAQRVKEARSPLLPQVDIGSQASVIDDDRAAASFGAQPENLWTGSIRATQLIYSDKAWANYSIEQSLQTSREQGRHTVELDITQAASTSYLNVLRARRIERIQKDNLKLTRQNLERAQIRVSIGAAGPEEVYRWESQIATSRQQVLLAESITLDTISTVNGILTRPLREMFTVKEDDYKDPLDILPSRHILVYMDNPRELNLLRDFLVKEALEASPELRQLDASIEAQERTIKLARREFWLPTFSLFGDVTETFDKSGEGSTPPPIGNLPSKDDTDWTAGVVATLPLFEGGGKSATLRRTRKELSGLKYQRTGTANNIEKRVLEAIYFIRVSFPSIRLTIDAADAAKRNLVLVTDSYTRGIKSIIDLIDAQNQSLVADQQAANAVYDFLIDLMSVQRSVGKFFFFAEEEDMQAFMDRLDQFMQSYGIQPTRG